MLRYCVKRAVWRTVCFLAAACIIISVFYLINLRPLDPVLIPLG